MRRRRSRHSLLVVPPVGGFKIVFVLRIVVGRLQILFLEIWLEFGECWCGFYDRPVSQFLRFIWMAWGTHSSRRFDCRGARLRLV
jgi:hypothetical protein